MINRVNNVDFREAFKTIEEWTKGRPYVVISDPPYNVNYKYDTYGDNLSHEEYVALISNMKGIPSVMIHFPEQAVSEYVPAMGQPKRIIPWVYNSNLMRQTRLVMFWDCEPNMNLVRQPYKNPTDKRIKQRIADGKVDCRSYDWWHINIVKNVSKDRLGNTHPCPIPPKLVENIIDSLGLSKDTIIIDPFAGSGTTCQVAKQKGYDYVGFDISSEYSAYANSVLDGITKGE